MCSYRFVEKLKNISRKYPTQQIGNCKDNSSRTNERSIDRVNESILRRITIDGEQCRLLANWPISHSGAGWYLRTVNYTAWMNTYIETCMHPFLLIHNIAILCNASSKSQSFGWGRWQYSCWHFARCGTECHNHFSSCNANCQKEYDHLAQAWFFDYERSNTFHRVCNGSISSSNLDTSVNISNNNLIYLPSVLSS